DQLVELLLPGEQVALLAQEGLQQGELVLASELLALEVRLGGAGEVLQERGDAQHQQREDDDQQPPVPGLTYAPEVLRKEVDAYHRGPLLPPVATPAGTGSWWISPSVNAGHPPQRQAQRDRELRRHLLEVLGVEAVLVDVDRQPRVPELDAEAERVADGLGQAAQLGAAAGDDHAADVRVAALHAEELEGAPDLGGQLHQHRPQGLVDAARGELLALGVEVEEVLLV